MALFRDTTEHFVIRLDRDFDRFRSAARSRSHRATRSNRRGPTRRPCLLSITVGRPMRSSLPVGRKDAASSLPVHSGSDTLRDVSTPQGRFSPGDESLIQPADPRERGRFRSRSPGSSSRWPPTLPGCDSGGAGAGSGIGRSAQQTLLWVAARPRYEVGLGAGRPQPSLQPARSAARRKKPDSAAAVDADDIVRRNAEVGQRPGRQRRIVGDDVDHLGPGRRAAARADGLGLAHPRPRPEDLGASRTRGQSRATTRSRSSAARAGRRPSAGPPRTGRKASDRCPAEPRPPRDRSRGSGSRRETAVLSCKTGSSRR